MPKKKSTHHNRTRLALEHSVALLAEDSRLAMTMPNTPNRGERVKPERLWRQNDADRGDTLARIKSINKVDLKSPIFYRNALVSPLGMFDVFPDMAHDQASLLTNRTNRTLALKILSIAPKLLGIRSYYDDFTTIDWARAYIQTNKFNYELHSGSHVDPLEGPSEDAPRSLPFVSKAYYVLGKWLLIVIIAFFFAIIAYVIDKFEILIVGFKYGYCRTNWFASEITCCGDVNARRASPLIEPVCPDWVLWSTFFGDISTGDILWIDFAIYVLLCVAFACVAGAVTLTTKIPARLPIAKEKLISESQQNTDSRNMSVDDFHEIMEEKEVTRTLYTGAGSGVPEVKTILSGFVIRRFLGSYTLFAKTVALIFAIASGLSLGKEGPYVHLATCVGNVATRFFSHINDNELLKKQILSASASSGVALAFGSPLGGVLFILEEINHYLPSHQLFLVFFCAITSTLFLKFLDPYGTHKTVLFELNYTSDWNAAELTFFIIIGIAGGVFGAGFIKFARWWGKWFRLKKFIKDRSMLEIILVSLLTGIVTYWNVYTKQASAELVLDLGTPCTAHNINSPLCLRDSDLLASEIRSLLFAFVVKIVLTFITFGLTLPCGIYVPSMVAGALFGRLFAMGIQLAHQEFSSHDNSLMRFVCHENSPQCVDLGIYAIISAGAFMAGVTRMNITLVTILFELTSSYTYVLPIAIAIAVANWMGNLLEENSLYEYLLIANDYPFMSPETEAVDPFVSAGDLLTSAETYVSHTEESSLEDSKQSSTQNIDDSIGDIANLAILKEERLFIDISDSPYVSSKVLYNKLLSLATKSLLDGCITLVKDDTCVGAIYFSELEFCLDRLKKFSYELSISRFLFCKVYKAASYPEDSLAPQEKHNLDVLDEGLEFSLRTTHNTGGGPDYFNYGSNEEYLEFANDKMEIREQLGTLVNFVDFVDTSPIFINHDSSLALAHLIFDRIGTRTVILQKDGKYFGVLHKKALVDYCRRPLK